MARLSVRRIKMLVNVARDGKSAQARGQALEELVIYLFSALSCIIFHEKDAVDYAQASEIDVLFANNNLLRGGLFLLPNVILVECKNRIEPVDNQQVTVILDRMQQRYCRMGILVTRSGITGDRNHLTAARDQISRALEKGFHIVVVTLDELESIRSGDELVSLLHKKWLQLKAFRTSL